MKISFDFDGTLQREDVQQLAMLMKDTYELWIVTARFYVVDNGQRDLFEVAKKLDIPRERILFTYGMPKWKTLVQNGIFIHYDDDPIEHEMIKEWTNNIIGLQV